MINFALIAISQVQGRIRFSKLEIDGICPFDLFCEQIRLEGNLVKQLKNVTAIMDRVSNGQLVSGDKFRDITTVGDHIKEYEIKTRDLRIYVFKERGNIIVSGGKKSTQRKDIQKFRSIKRQYINSIQP